MYRLGLLLKWVLHSGTRGLQDWGSGGWPPQLAVLIRCLEKLQLFQPAFAICPFEMELNVDIAAALKVCLDPSWPSLPWPLPGSAAHSHLI